MTISEESVGFPAGSDGKESACYLRGIKDEKKKERWGKWNWRIFMDISLSLSVSLCLSVWYREIIQSSQAYGHNKNIK